jgi:hypothetical protein
MAAVSWPGNAHPQKPSGIRDLGADCPEHRLAHSNLTKAGSHGFSPQLLLTAKTLVAGKFGLPLPRKTHRQF